MLAVASHNRLGTKGTQRGSSFDPRGVAGQQVVGRTLHHTNHLVIVTGDPLPGRLTSSRGSQGPSYALAAVNRPPLEHSKLKADNASEDLPEVIAAVEDVPHPALSNTSSADAGQYRTFPDRVNDVYLDGDRGLRRCGVQFDGPHHCKTGGCATVQDREFVTDA
ncbi:hypothetical protein [Actinoplanes sp. NPDC020271]|uniref:hypothetical protein n=1 Tax=Actinoplanes sp. NPDC020271 TaxID=3363896 RepID=UPI00379FD467